MNRRKLLRNNNLPPLGKLLKLTSHHLNNEIDFSEILNTECPNVAYDKFTLTFKDAFNSAFPLSKVRTNKRYMKREPWLIFF